VGKTRKRKRAVTVYYSIDERVDERFRRYVEGPNPKVAYSSVAEVALGEYLDKHARKEEGKS
jgi:hypothetical protein